MHFMTQSELLMLFENWVNMEYLCCAISEPIKNQVFWKEEQ